MGGTLAGILGIFVMSVCLLLVPLGLPGAWLMLSVVAAGAVLGAVSLQTLGALVLLVAAAELVEWLLVRVFSARFGGSSRAFWGAVIGGLVGVLIGMPVPVVGALLAGVLGTFLGAAAFTWMETRALGPAARVGWGAVLGRAFSAAVKTAAAIIVLVVGGGALLVG